MYLYIRAIQPVNDKVSYFGSLLFSRRKRLILFDRHTYRKKEIICETLKSYKNVIFVILIHIYKTWLLGSNKLYYLNNINAELTMILYNIIYADFSNKYYFINNVVPILYIEKILEKTLF